jgi:hypothetical protein
MLAQPETVGRVEALDAAVAKELTGFLDWGSIIAGALLATAVSLVLVAFGSSIGLAILSSSPSWRDTSPALTLVSGFYLLLTALTSFIVGGYAAARFRERRPAVPSSAEREFRDGAHGVLAWAIAVVISGLVVTVSGAVVASKMAAPAASPTATTGEPLIATQLDGLLRTLKLPPGTDIAYIRAEAGRYLLTATGRNGITPEDRAYLVRLVTSETGIAPPDAERRVEEAIAGAKTAVHRFRASGVILGFSTAASLLLGAAAAWGAATVGGRRRDEAALPIGWRW